MADETRVNYVITIRTEGGSGGESGGSGEAGSRGDAAGGKKKKSFGEMNTYEKFQYVTKLAPVGYAMKMADSYIVNDISRVELRTGNAVLQQKIDYAYNALKSKLAIGGMVAAGIATANPLLLFGAAASIVSNAVELEQRRTTLNLERQVESVGIGMANIRAGAYGSRGRKDQI